ncbi:hypothetical protein BLSTO_00923 [Blastocystis sp. subtype 1]
MHILCLGSSSSVLDADAEVEPAGETDDIDDILEANVDEPEEADDDVSYEGEEETPVIMKSLKFPVHPLTDIPEPSSDIEVTYKFLSGTRCSNAW